MRYFYSLPRTLALQFVLATIAQTQRGSQEDDAQKWEQHQKNLRVAEQFLPEKRRDELRMMIARGAFTSVRRPYSLGYHLATTTFFRFQHVLPDHGDPSHLLMSESATCVLTSSGGTLESSSEWDGIARWRDQTIVLLRADCDRRIATPGVFDHPAAMSLMSTLITRMEKAIDEHPTPTMAFDVMAQKLSLPHPVLELAMCIFLHLDIGDKPLGKVAREALVALGVQPLAGNAMAWNTKAKLDQEIGDVREYLMAFNNPDVWSRTGR